MDDQELTRRLGEAASELTVSDAARQSHVAAINDALIESPVIPFEPRQTRRGRRLVAVAVAAAVIGPTGLAAASSDALPGDPLYGIKQVSERIVVLFDSEVVARHRVEEFESLALEGRERPADLERAVDAVSGLSEDHPLRTRIATADDEPSKPEDTSDESPPDDDVADTQDTIDVNTIDIELPDGVVATVTIKNGLIIDVAVSEPWVTDEIDDDHANLVSDTTEVRLTLHGDGSISVEPQPSGTPEDNSETDEATDRGDSGDDSSDEPQDDDPPDDESSSDG